MKQFQPATRIPGARLENLGDKNGFISDMIQKTQMGLYDKGTLESILQVTFEIKDKDGKMVLARWFHPEPIDNVMHFNSAAAKNQFAMLPSDLSPANREMALSKLKNAVAIYKGMDNRTMRQLRQNFKYKQRLDARKKEIEDLQEKAVMGIYEEMSDAIQKQVASAVPGQGTERKIGMSPALGMGYNVTSQMPGPEVSGKEVIENSIKVIYDARMSQVMEVINKYAKDGVSTAVIAHETGIDGTDSGQQLTNKTDKVLQKLKKAGAIKNERRGRWSLWFPVAIQSS